MSDSRTLFKWGCFGCLALLGLVLILAAAVFGLAWNGVRQEEPQTDVAEARPVPAVEETTSDAGALRIVFDVASVDLTLAPVETDEEFRVEAVYDKRTYAFEETRTTSADGATVWNIGFRKTSRSPFVALRSLFGGTRSSIEISVPDGVPYSIEGVVQGGSLQAEIGGTLCREIDVDLQRGAVVMSVRRPLAEPMRRFAIESNQGANVVTSLGNASPREVSVDCSMGACVLDLTGEWRNDSDIALAVSLGAGVLTVDEDVDTSGLDDVKGFRPSLAGPEDSEIPRPKLRFRIDGNWEMQ